jgi:hypothetical protein
MTRAAKQLVGERIMAIDHTSKVTKVNVWPEEMEDGSGEAWFFATWCGDEHDANGDVPRGVTDPVAWASEQWPSADVREVEGTA